MSNMVLRDASASKKNMQYPQILFAPKDLGSESFQKIIRQMIEWESRCK